MDARERFRRLTHGLPLDRTPNFEEEIREEVLENWHAQGLPAKITLENYREFFGIDRYDYLYLELEPRPGPLQSEEDFRRIEEGYRTDSFEFRQPAFWEARAREYEKRDFPLGVTGWRGFMLPLFSQQSEWSSFQEVLLALCDRPERVRHALSVVAECYAEAIELALRYLDFDFGVILEPIASPTGPVISPAMFRDFVFPCHRSMVDFFHSCGINVVIFRSFANLKSLLPAVVESGVDGLWIGHIHGAIDYLELRDHYPGMLLMGGIDWNALAAGERAIDEAVNRVVPPLLAGGRYAPALDGRVRENVAYGRFQHYRRALLDATGA